VIHGRLMKLSEWIMACETRKRGVSSCSRHAGTSGHRSWFGRAPSCAYVYGIWLLHSKVGVKSSFLVAPESFQSALDTLDEDTARDRDSLAQGEHEQAFDSATRDRRLKLQIMPERATSGEAVFVCIH
jgi:hypothetical protein